MIVSLRLTGPHRIDITKNGKFNYKDEKLSIKEIPFVRYNFDSYGDSELAYISESIKKFNYSGHLVEIEVAQGYLELCRRIRKEIPDCAIFLYTNVTDAEVAKNELDSNKNNELCLLNGSGVYIDRLMIKDTSLTLHTVSANKIKSSLVSLTGMDINDIGIHESPLSFGDECCLTAERARRLCAQYNSNEKCALPSANHQGMNCCGCIRYYIVDCDLICENPIVNAMNVPQTDESESSADAENKSTKSSVKNKKPPVKKVPKNVMRAWGLAK